MTFNWKAAQKTARKIESRTVFRSGRTEIVGLRNMCLCSKISHKVKTWSMQSRPGQQLAWFSTTSLSRIFTNRRSIMPKSSLCAMITKQIPVWLSHDNLPLFVQIDTNDNVHRFWRPNFLPWLVPLALLTLMLTHRCHSRRRTATVHLVPLPYVF